MAEAVEERQRTLWSILALAEQLQRPWNTVKRKLKHVPPDGHLNGKPAWYLSTAAPHLVEPAEKPERKKNPEDMDPRDRLDWAKGDETIMRNQERARLLVPIVEVREEMATMAKIYVTGLDTLPDVLERKAALTPKQAEVVQTVCDELRERIYKANGRDHV